MKTTYFLLLIFLLTSSAVYAQVTEQWIMTYNGLANRDDHADFVAVDGSGNIYVTGKSQGYDYHTNTIIIKYGPSGGQQWVTMYGDPFTGLNYPVGLTIDNSGNVYVLAYNNAGSNPPTTEYLTIKYNASGQVIWAAHYVGPIYGTSLPKPADIAVDGSGNVYVTGFVTNSSNTKYLYATVKYDANSNILWSHTYESYGGDSEPSAIAIDNSGNTFVTGFGYFLSPTYENYLTVKYSPSGTFQWAAIYTGPTNGDNAATSIAVDGSGNSYVTGNSTGTDSHLHCATVKYNSSGVQQWVARYNGSGTGNDDAAKVVLKNGYIYVGGTSAGGSTGKDYLAIKYAANGNELWNATYSGQNGDDFGNDIAVDDYGLVYVTGFSAGPVHSKIATVRFNSNGTLQWIQQHALCPNIRDEGAYSIALGPNNGNGVVVVAGTISHDQCANSDFCTIKYTQTGLGITQISGNIPDKYSLEQNYPNPFNPVTNINFSLPAAGKVRLIIYDMLGKEIETIVNEDLAAGTYKADFDASKLSSGIYLYKLTANSFSEVKKMVFVK
ncbi:MAG TPA: SBBP repeat-containing protein [Ignavibacteria bacterium]|jgi:hypothetical protein